MKNIRNVNLKGKKVILRTDFNVPLENGKIINDSRIIEALPTIEYILKSGGSIIIISHLGRPDGKKISALSLKPVAKRLEKLLDKKVDFIPESIGARSREKAENLKPKQVLMLENLRFNVQEELGDPEFAKKLAGLGDIFVQEAFSSAHRSHASMLAITKFLPSYAGLHFEKEYMRLTEIFDKPKKPFVFVAGGKKVETKVEILKKVLDKADIILFGGGLANTFLVAEGHEVGKSFYEEEYVSDAETVIRDGYDKGVEILLPTDVIIAKNPGESANIQEKDVQQVGPGDIIVDIGPKTVAKYAQPIKFAGTIFWNGPLGIAEKERSAGGTKAIANMILNSGTVAVIGGGDTVAALDRLKISGEDFTHVSTAGGALMALLSGEKLPAVEVLR